jgi:putative membrane protein
MSTKKTPTIARNSIFIIFTVLFSLAAAQTIRAENAPITDDGFVRDAFLSNQTEIEISSIAVEKSHNAGVKKLAKAIIKDYTTANAELRSLAAPKRLEVPALLDSSHKAQVEQLKSIDNQAFDTRYRAQIQQHHDAAIAMYDRIAKNPRSDAELRVYASKMLPVLQKYQKAVVKMSGAPIAVANRKAL